MEKEQIKICVEKAKENNQEAMKELYELTMNSAYFAAKKFIKVDQDALDIVQDSYITAFTKLPQLNEGSKFPQWLNKIVSNRLNLTKGYLII